CFAYSTNSLMSAPTAKPAGLAECTITPAGCSIASRSTIWPSSSSTARLIALTLLPARSRLSVTMPRSSRLVFQWLKRNPSNMGRGGWWTKPEPYRPVRTNARCAPGRARTDLRRVSESSDRSNVKRFAPRGGGQAPEWAETVENAPCIPADGAPPRQPAPNDPGSHDDIDDGYAIAIFRSRRLRTDPCRACRCGGGAQRGWRRPAGTLPRHRPPQRA